MDIHSLFEAAEREGRVGVTRKAQEVDARPAVPGEVVVTHIADEGKETQSKPAAAGDMVVRNRCESTGNEEYLVSTSTFPQRYEGPLGPEDAQGWCPYRPLGPKMLYLVVRPEDGAFSFTAPWVRRWWRGRAMLSSAIQPTPKIPSGRRRVLRVHVRNPRASQDVALGPFGDFETLGFKVGWDAGVWRLHASDWGAMPRAYLQEMGLHDRQAAASIRLRARAMPANQPWISALLRGSSEDFPFSHLLYRPYASRSEHA